MPDTAQNIPSDWKLDVREVALGEYNPGLIKVQSFLEQFGYLKEPKQDGILGKTTSKALSRFQTLYSLPVTGVLDELTAQAMELPRCALPDDISEDYPDSIALKTSATYIEENDDQSPVHYRKSFTYAFKNFTTDLPKKTVKDIIRRAFSEWETHTGLAFSEIDKVPADIEIEFGANNPEPSGTVLGWATLGGHTIHFKDGWSWKDISRSNERYSAPLLSVAIHEIGHILGLQHSTTPTLMAPANAGRARLHSGDVQRIQALYPRRQLLAIGGHVISWNGHDNGYRVWEFDHSKKDPIPSPAIVEGHWSSIDDTHILLPIDGFVLDWIPKEGTYRLWQFDPTQSDPLPGSAVQSGRWSSIRAGHVLVPIGKYILDWIPRTGAFRLWNFDATKSDPLSGSAVQEGKWSSVGHDHVLIPIKNKFVLDWQPRSGEYRLYKFDPSSADPLADPPIQRGTWSSIRSGHVLIPVSDYVIDWVPHTGEYRLWQFDAAQSDPLPSAVQRGLWNSVVGQ